MHMEKIALCVGKGREICYMMYGGEHQFLNSVEMRADFEGAAIGQWFRVSIDSRKGCHVFESIGKSEAPPTRVLQDADENLIQVQLPIFFVSKVDNEHLSDFPVLFSPVLEDIDISVNNCDFSDHALIKPWVQYEAFLTLKGWEIGIPRWSLKSLSDIVMENNKLNIISKLAHLINQKEHGFVLKLFAENRLALILCLQDGQLAIATNESIRNISVGDYVNVCCREVGRPVYPSITSSKLFVIGLSLHKKSDLCVGSSSFFPLKSLEGDKLFELRFPITNLMLSSTFTGRGSMLIDNIGVLLDPDGKLSNQLSSERLNQIIVVQARLCLVPERQSPLWFIVNVFYAENEVKETAKVMDEQSFDCTDEDDLRSEENLSQNKENEIKIGGESDKESHNIDGGFGEGWKRLEKKRFDGEVKREQRSCVDESLNASIGASSISSSSESIRNARGNLPTNDGIALFIQIKSYEWILALFDKQIKKFTQWCCTLIKSLPLNADQRSPIPGNWFQIFYAFNDTHQCRRAQKHILISSMFPAQSADLPIQISPNNKEVWTMVINGKFDCALKKEGTSSKIYKPPIPVTNVFLPANSETPIQNQQNSSNRPKFPSSAFNSGLINRKPNVFTRNNNHLSDPTRLERFFCVSSQMAGIVVGCLLASNPETDAKNTYRIWPFCTGTATPRELMLNTSTLLALGTWIKFNAVCYQKGEIEETSFNELGHWLETSVNEGPKATKVCLECSIQIPPDYDPISEVHNQIWTCRFKPTSPNTPFIKKLVPIDELKPYLKEHRGKYGIFVRLEYRREFGKDGQTVGYWQIAELLASTNRKNDLKD